MKTNGLISFPRAQGTPKVGAPAGWTVTGGSPVATAWRNYTSDDGQRFSGRWHCTTGSFEVVYDKWEFCHIISGACTITPKDGEPVHLRAGDAFVIEPGFVGEWVVDETMEKHFVFVIVDTPNA